VGNADETDKRMNIPATFNRATFRERGKKNDRIGIVVLIVVFILFWILNLLGFW
jgi:hypothetical protein